MASKNSQQEKKIESITLRVTSKQKEAWATQAEQLGKSLSQFLIDRIENSSQPDVIDGTSIARGLFSITTLLQQRSLPDKLQIRIQKMCDDLVDGLYDMILGGGR